MCESGLRIMSECRCGDMFADKVFQYCVRVVG